MSKSAGMRQYGWHFYRGLTRIQYSGRGSAVQLVHGKRYQVQFTMRKSGKCTAVVHDGFSNIRINYNSKKDFDREWIARKDVPVAVEPSAIYEKHT